MLHYLPRNRAAYLPVAAWVLVGIGNGTAAEMPPTVDVALVSNQVYVGETPRVKITVTAPAKQAVAVVKDEAAVYKRQSLDVNLLAAQRTRVPGGMPSYFAKKTADDMVRLEAGKALTMEFSVLSAPSKAGKFFVQVKFTPTADEKLIVDKELDLTCVDIDEKTVLDRVAIKVPKNPHWANVDPEVVELLNVKTDKGYELLFRKVKTLKAGTVCYLVRVCALDETSKITGVPKFFDRREHVQRFWVSYTKGGELYFAQLEYVTGQVLENIPMSQLIKVAEPKN